MSPIYNNALDSLRHGIEHYLNRSDDSNHNQTILSLSHASERLLEERLNRLNPSWRQPRVSKIA